MEMVLLDGILSKTFYRVVLKIGFYRIFWRTILWSGSKEY